MIRPHVISRFAVLLSFSLFPLFPLKSEITVGSAISMSDVVTEISEAHSRETGTKIRHTFAGTNVIARQIEAGAPIDIFLSADTAHMDALVAKGLVEKESVRIIATNELVVIIPADSKLSLKSPRGLLSLDRLAIADPTSVPAGIYAKRWLETEGVWARLAPKTIPLQNVRAALLAVETGNADAAIVYRTDALSSRKVKSVFTVPEGKTGAIEYPAAVVAGSTRREDANRFLEFMASEKSAAIFMKHGFGVP